METKKFQSKITKSTNVSFSDVVRWFVYWGILLIYLTVTTLISVIPYYLFILPTNELYVLVLSIILIVETVLAIFTLPKLLKVMISWDYWKLLTFSLFLVSFQNGYLLLISLKSTLPSAFQFVSITITYAIGSFILIPTIVKNLKEIFGEVKL